MKRGIREGEPLMAWSTPSAHDSSSRNCQRWLLGHDGGTGTPPGHHDRSLAVSVVQDHSVTHRRSRSLLLLTGRGPTREDLPGACRVASVTAGPASRRYAHDVEQGGPPRYRRGQ